MGNGKHDHLDERITMNETTITERLDAGESIDTADLASATDAELVDVVKNESYPISLRAAAHAALVEVTYEHLKLVDRVRPGRTPWQTLRKRAETQVLEELGSELTTWSVEKTPGGMTVHSAGDYRIESTPGFNGNGERSGRHAPTIQLFHAGRFVRPFLTVHDAKIGAGRMALLERPTIASA